jgi:methionine aminotransferase
MQKVHQFTTFCIATPLQVAIADYMRGSAEYFNSLPRFFQAKRDRLRAALAGTAFRLPPSEGTYFQLLDFSSVAPPGDVEFAERLITEVGLATIPISPFYETPPMLSVLRLCLAKRDEYLDEAAARLRSFKP